MSKTWTQRARESPHFISITGDYSKKTYDSGLQKGAYLWTGLPIWKRIALSPVFSIWTAYQCIRGRDVHVAFIEEKSENWVKKGENQK